MSLTLTRRSLLGWLGTSGATALVAPAMPALAGPAIEPDDIRAPLHPSEVVIRPLDAFFDRCKSEPSNMQAAIIIARHFPAVKVWQIDAAWFVRMTGCVGSVVVTIAADGKDAMAVEVRGEQEHRFLDGRQFRPASILVDRFRFDVGLVDDPAGGKPLTLDERVATRVQYWRDENAARYHDSLALFGGWRG